MQIGRPVSVNGNHWRGVIVDIAISDMGAVMLKIDSPKGVFYNTPPEWLEYIPLQITACDALSLEMEAAKWSLRLQDKARDTGRFSQVTG